MNIYKTYKLLTMTTAIALVSTTAVLAESISAKDSMIRNLPESGSVTLMGQVKTVEDQDTFILRDSEGKTIDVHTKAASNVKEGASVRVNGMVSDEIAGFGREITDANVNTVAVADMAKVTTDAEGEVKGAANANVSPDASASAKIGNTKLGAAVDVEKATTATIRKEEAKHEAKANVNAETRRNMATNTNVEASYDVDVEGDVSKLAPAAGTNNFTRIELLPKNGAVELTAVVDEVNNDKKFTVRDTDGETIDVNTSSNVSVKKGERVQITGKVQSEMAGMGREIIASDVMRLSQK